MMTGLAWQAEVLAAVNLHGFVQGNYAVNTAAENPDGDSFKWAEERVQLKFDAALDPLQFFVKVDAFHDHPDDKADGELREGYIDYGAARWDARAGRQVLTWGVGDLVFINDVFPKDYEAFFAGRPLEYLKKGIDGLRLGAYPDFASLELVLIPLFEPNQYPESGRFWLYDPLPGVTARTTREPDEVLGNGEIAVRAYRRIADFDGALYAYRGYSRQPAMAPDSPAAPWSLTFTYPELAVYGASLQGSALHGVVSLEAGSYDSLGDQDGADPMLPNSQWRFLVGYQRQLWEEGTLGLQYYAEVMRDYDAYTETMPPGFPREREVHGYISVRFTQFFRNQTLKFSWFSFVSPDEGDFLLNPELTYHFTDHVWAAVGAMVFGGGDEWSRFGQLAENDHGYLQVRYEW
ncbi:MAG: hypothetical protein ACYC9M_04850 [Desulfobulbaceae bacterium]